MSQSTASIGTVLTTLKSNFTTQLASSDLDGGQIPVSFGPQRDFERESVLIGDLTSPGEQKWALLGNSSREEQYAVNVTVLAGDPRKQTFDDQVARAFSVFGTLETWLRANVDLGLSSTFTHLRCEVATVNVQQYPHPDHNGPVVQIDFAVRVITRI